MPLEALHIQRGFSKPLGDLQVQKVLHKAIGCLWSPYTEELCTYKEGFIHTNIWTHLHFSLFSLQIQDMLCKAPTQRGLYIAPIQRGLHIQIGPQEDPRCLAKPLGLYTHLVFLYRYRGTCHEPLYRGRFAQTEGALWSPSGLEHTEELLKPLCRGVFSNSLYRDVSQSPKGLCKYRGGLTKPMGVHKIPIQRGLCTYRGSFVMPLGVWHIQGDFIKPLYRQHFENTDGASYTNTYTHKQISVFLVQILRGYWVGIKYLYMLGIVWNVKICTEKSCF